MEAMIKKMRADWTVVTLDRKQAGEWSDTDEQEIGEAVRSAIDSGEAGAITLWARWLADLAATSITLKAVIVGIDSRIRDAARKHREATAK